MKTKKLILTVSALFMLCISMLAQNPKVANGVATYVADKKIGQKFMVPDSWDKIIIKKNVTVTGNFVTPDSRKKDITVEGEDWNTSVLKGTGKVATYPNNVDNRRYLSAISNNGTGTLYVKNLKSYNPDKFHLRSEARIIVEHCRIIQDAGIPKGHADAVHGGRGSKSEVHDCYISTWDDATYSSECWLVKNTTIVMNGNGAAFQVGYGTNYVHKDPVCRVINCSVIANGKRYSKGVVAWTNCNYKGGPNHAKIYFENFKLSTNAGKTPLKMYTMGGNGGKKLGTNCEIHVTSDESVCNLTSYEYRSNSNGVVRLFDCCKYIDKKGVHTTSGCNGGGNKAPIANAGKDKTITDSDGNGTEMVTLNGGDSYDPDGKINTYVWTKGNEQLATGVSPKVILTTGIHSITLTVTDNKGKKDSDDVKITVSQCTNCTDKTPPTIPTGLTVTNVADKSVSLKWNASTDSESGVAGYRVYENGIQVADVSGLSATVKALSCETSYSFAVSAYDKQANESEAGSEVQATTSSCSSQPVTVTLTPINDAFLQGNKGYNINLIRIEPKKRTSYLMFDLSSVDGPITKAVLKLKCASDAGNGNVKINLGKTNNWTEKNLTSKNKPALGVQLATLNKAYKIGSVYTWNLNTTSISGGDKLSLIVTQVSGNDVAFGSKENAAKPVLEITYTGSPKMSEMSNEATSLEVYPNPSNGIFNVAVSGNEKASLKIINLTGAVVYSSKLEEGLNPVDASRLVSGIYLVQVKTNTKTIQQRIIIQ
ncbi:MAG: T9SS type A sorting domain-containing protein [Bacteroidales bacterium]|nr:T9SS type A sorting domain-containing protein [Bacteroidales bacterium]